MRALLIAAALLAGCTTTIIDPEIGDQAQLDYHKGECASVAKHNSELETPLPQYKGMTIMQVWKKCMESRGYRILH